MSKMTRTKPIIYLILGVICRVRGKQDHQHVTCLFLTTRQTGSLVGHIKVIFTSMATDAETKYFSSSSYHDDIPPAGLQMQKLVLQ